jgi:hypothetical protein
MLIDGDVQLKNEYKEKCQEYNTNGKNTDKKW